MTHTVEDLYFAPWRTGQPCWLRCACGFYGDWPTAERLHEAWVAHRAEAGARKPGRVAGPAMEETPFTRDNHRRVA